MLTIIDPELVEQLKALAEREQRSVEDVLRSFVETSSPPLETESDPDAPPLGTLARLTYEAGKRDFGAGKNKTDADAGLRADDVLNDEFADYLSG